MKLINFKHNIWTVEESTPSMDGNYETFMVCDSYELALSAMELYETRYPMNEYRIQGHVLNDRRLIEMEVDHD